MTANAKRTFDSVSLLEEWGVADATGFHLHETRSHAPSGFPFTVCRIHGRQLAVFVEMRIPVDARAKLASRKPDWLDAVVYASVISDPGAEVAIIDAQVASPDDADLEACAFATACVADDLGSFNVEPTSYTIRFEGRATVRVSMDFDFDSESRFGEAARDS
jgi:hypothetical protein